ncbi:TICRR protein, partial [Crypturellus undulatus]|nr:TICRR protein [Crypturellus undulatus]
SMDGDGEMILEHCSSKVTNALGEFELEGVCRLQDQPSPSDCEHRAEEASAFRTFGLKSRKRVYPCLSPEREEKHEAKRSCTNMFNLDLIGLPQDRSKESKPRADAGVPEKRVCSLLTPVQSTCTGDDDVFLLSGSTPQVKNTLSVSSLLALTQSPLLSICQISALTSCLWFVEEESDPFQDLASPELTSFNGMASKKRSLSRTYSRKKLLS